MLIALDYDGTYTADKDMWNVFIHQARLRGHEVIIATMRYEETEGEEVIGDLFGNVDNIIFTGRKAKKAFVDANYRAPDIWIDDNPEWLFKDSM